MLISAFWPLFGGLSLVLSAVHLMYALHRLSNSSFLLFSSLFSLALTLLTGLWMIYGWTEKGDWSALMDVVPAMTALASLFALLIAVLNTAALLYVRRKHPPKEVS